MASTSWEGLQAEAVLKQLLPDPGHGAVLRGHHEVPGGAVQGVGEELRHVDVVSVGLPRRYWHPLPSSWLLLVRMRYSRSARAWAP